MKAHRVVLAASTTALALSTFGIVLGVSGGCRHDRPPPEVLPDAPQLEVRIDDPTTRLYPPSVLSAEGKDEPADLSCLGIKPDAGLPILDADPDAAPLDDATVPPNGTLVEKEIEVVGFGTGGSDKLVDTKIDVYFFNTFKRAPDLVDVLTDDKGIARVKVPYGLPVGYHTKASTRLVDFWGLDDFHMPIGGIKETRWTGMTRERYEVLGLAVTGEKGYTLPPKTGIVSGRVQDCKRRNIQFARIGLVDLGTGLPVELGKCGKGACLVYLSDNELPRPEATFTSRAGLFSFVQIPSDARLRMTASAVVGDPEAGVLTEIAHRDLEVKEGALVNQFMFPSGS